ncbi:hypothetical protein [Streptomyces azureus]|uniref:hypothetical protein n=1 Tax=Streptomyces azureus TaxID=146537 RepID=UPI001F2C6CE5|nr:hypothetical protein [Streptomyces azureus]
MEACSGPSYPRAACRPAPAVLAALTLAGATLSGVPAVAAPVPGDNGDVEIHANAAAADNSAMTLHRPGPRPRQVQGPQGRLRDLQADDAGRRPADGGGGIARGEALTPVAGAAAVGPAAVAGTVGFPLRRRPDGTS